MKDEGIEVLCEAEGKNYYVKLIKVGDDFRMEVRDVDHKLIKTIPFKKDQIPLEVLEDAGL
jgi:hypothetical protein